MTITGVGGVGKTTIALGLARLQVDAFPQGVWWFELAALRDPELIATEMMGALRLPPRADVPHLDTVCAALSDRTALLVIDNCEHLIADVARIAEVILRRCPGVKLLATSREPLAVPGEVAWSLPTLSLPESAARAAEVLDADATRLFQLRAREADRGFEVTDANAARIASICRRLDGLPFAIELAAARLRSMGLTELEDRLDDRFRVLTGGSRTEVPHHQTLRGTVEWSYDLLAPEEQRLYRRLSVFRGGFGLDAAEFVYGADGALDLVDALVAQSSVIADRVDDATRYRMLETIREHGHDLLAAAGETETARTAHMEYVAALVNDGARKLEGRESTKWMHRFRVETDNIRAALAHAVVADPVTGAAVCSGLSRFWWRHATEGDVTTLDDATSFLQEGRRWSEQMLQAAGREIPEKTRAGLLMALGGLLDIRLGYYDDAIARLEEAEALWTAIGNVRNRGWSVFYQGIASWGMVAVDETIGFFDRSNALHEEAVDPFGAGMSKMLRALALARAGHFDRGTPDLEAFEGMAQQTGNAFMLGHAEDARAMWAIGLGEAIDADRRRIIDAIRHFQTLGNYACLGHGIHTAAMLLAQEGRLEEAARCLGIVTAIRDRLGMVVAPYEDRTMWVEELGVDTLDEATRTRAENAGRSLEPETGIEWVIATVSPTSDSSVM